MHIDMKMLTYTGARFKCMFAEEALNATYVASDELQALGITSQAAVMTAAKEIRQAETDRRLQV